MESTQAALVQSRKLHRPPAASGNSRCRCRAWTILATARCLSYQQLWTSSDSTNLQPIACKWVSLGFKLTLEGLPGCKASGTLTATGHDGVRSRPCRSQVSSRVHGGRTPNARPGGNSLARKSTPGPTPVSHQNLSMLRDDGY